MMKIAKQFRWEGAHRLPWHAGLCRNLHGHSYALLVELVGEPDARGMLIDFHDVKQILKPLVDAWDHATFVAAGDDELLTAVRLLGTKHYVLPYDSTSENLCRFVAGYLAEQGGDVLARHNVAVIRVRIQETETCYAEYEQAVSAPTGAPAAGPVAACAD